MADFDTLPNDDERARLNNALRAAITGSAEQVEQKLAAMIDETGADEVMVLSLIHDPDARRRSLEIIGEVRDSINARRHSRV
jgi:alkanesulfonate monooxygenase SsuD/methylene tetrahydromethanopterin reductase-like flavin-dependent oxidoreductase (luciferase family)